MGDSWLNHLVTAAAAGCQTAHVHDQWNSGVDIYRTILFLDAGTLSVKADWKNGAAFIVQAQQNRPNGKK